MSAIEKIRDEIDAMSAWDDPWDLGYKAGLQRALELIRDEEWDKILEVVKGVYQESPND